MTAESRAVLSLIAVVAFIRLVKGAVLPPPWADPKLNPCAVQPKGWQLLYWPPDGKCYRIFKTGYPCPDDMELSPSPVKAGEPQRFSAECRCPPGKAQSARDGKCYELFKLGPCEKGSYFTPDTKYNNHDNNISKRLWGLCVQLKSCPSQNEIFWPKDGRCYQRLTKGPCPKGQLLTFSPDKIPECKCNEIVKELKEYRFNDGNCYQHFTKGPCKEKGDLFLPDRTCGCHSFLPHFHDDSQFCFEIGTIGPCGSGEHYQLHQETRRGTCQCKPGYIRYQNTSSCYRPYTQGPCGPHQILVNTTTCVQQPCNRGHLFFSTSNSCHRIGTRGPCRRGRIVTFDFEVRPSIDGVSYNGVCSCEKYVYSNKCDDHSNSTENDESSNEKVICNRSEGLVLYQKRCYKLYTQGPCPRGAWIAVKRRKKDEELWSDDDDDDNSRDENEGVCECVPGYTKIVRTLRDRIEIDCMAPTVILADYLNRNFSAQFL